MDQGNVSGLSEDQVMKILASDIAPGLPVPVDLFVYLPTEGYLQVLRGGKGQTLQSLHLSYQAKDFFVRRSDFRSLTSYNLRLLEVLSSRTPSASQEKMVVLLTSCLSAVSRELLVLGVDAESLMRSQAHLSRLIKHVALIPNLALVILALEEVPDYLLKRAMFASILALRIGQDLGWPPDRLYELFVGVTCADLGYQKLPPELRAADPNTFSAHERAVWMAHSEYSYYSLLTSGGAGHQKTNELIPKSILRIVREHHETSTGNGFPNGLKDQEISIPSKIAGASLRFAELCLPSPWDPKGRSFEECILQIEVKDHLPYPISIWTSLKRCLGL